VVQFNVGNDSGDVHERRGGDCKIRQSEANDQRLKKAYKTPRPAAVAARGQMSSGHALAQRRHAALGMKSNSCTASRRYLGVP
jgi:uncharacterized protein YecT (DUF1311 family)